jgi:hypothetical protein
VYNTLGLGCELKFLYIINVIVVVIIEKISSSSFTGFFLLLKTAHLNMEGTYLI